MPYSLAGKLIIKKPQFIVIEAGGIGFKVFVSSESAKKLPGIGSKTKIFCSLYLYKNGFDLYGFLSEEEKEFFELISATHGIGPKSALAILSNFSKEKLASIISENRADLLAKAWGVGRKKAERLILELKSKIKKQKRGNWSLNFETDQEIETILRSLSYKPNEIKEVLDGLPEKTQKLEDRLKLALKFLNQHSKIIIKK